MRISEVSFFYGVYFFKRIENLYYRFKNRVIIKKLKRESELSHAVVKISYA
jgi:hypothetical protein